METTPPLADMVLDLRGDRKALMKIAFPQAKVLLGDEALLSGSDEAVFLRWVMEVIEPALQQSGTAVKEGLRACLEPRTAARIAAVSAAVDFISGFLPAYPSNLAGIVAALVVLSAYELRDRGKI